MDNEIKIIRASKKMADEDDLSKYTPEQLKVITDQYNKRTNTKMGGIVLVVIVGLIIATIVSIPLIARLYSWGFGG